MLKTKVSSTVNSKVKISLLVKATSNLVMFDFGRTWTLMIDADDLPLFACVVWPSYLQCTVTAKISARNSKNTAPATNSSATVRHNADHMPRR